MRFIYLGLIAALLFFCLLFAFMQTKWAKKKISQAIAAACAANGIQIKIGRVEGSLPFTWHIDRIALKWDTEDALHLHNIKVRFAIFPLLKKTLVANYFNVEKAYFVFASPSYSQPLALEEIKTQAKKLAETLSMSHRLVIDRLKIDSLLCENLSVKKTGLYFIVANIDLGKNLRHFQCNAMISPRGHPENAVQCDVEGSQKLNYGSVNLKVHLSSLEPFQPFYTFASEQEIHCAFSIAGKWTNWSAFFHDAPLSSPLSGFFKGELHPLSSYPILNRPWEIDAQFAIDSYHSLFIRSCFLHNDVLDVNLSGEIEQDLLQSSGHLSFALPDLSILDPKICKGSANGEASYAQGRWTSDIFAEHAECKGLLLDQLSARIEAACTDQGWEGHAQMKTQGGPLPMRSTVDFLSQGENLSLYGFSLDGPGFVLAGDLSINLQNLLAAGALYGHVEHLDSLSFLFDQKTIDASLGLECQFLPEGEKQTVRGSLLGKNTVYGDQTIDQFSLKFSIRDLFCQPLGTLHLSAEGLHNPLYDIHTLDFTTASAEEEEWPFTVQIEGNLEDPFSLYAQGKWKKEEQLFSLETTSLSGKLLSYPIELQSPFLFEKGAHFASLTPVDMIIGDGHLFGAFDLNPVRSTAHIDLEHFPITLFSLFYPNHTLAGALSLKGYVDAYEDNMQGNLNAVLEEMHFLHFDKKQPFQAKGSLQAHLDHGIVQTHAHLAATKEQFIDFSATLPISYTVYPLHLALNTHQPVASELIAEGRLQDLFDFINIGIHQMTGYVSSRLFLSQTLDAPALQGNIEWQGGTYENFLTGTLLKDIHAKIQAEKNILQLISFSANDDKKGTVHAEGTIDLHPSAHFPYQFIAELDNFRTVHFNPLDCNLSGALYISGTLHEALAQGNLLIPHAEFHIPDKLPFEIPVLPVTFMNRPHSLSSTDIMPSPTFPFRIHLELTAEEHVQVTGKGLNSEWKGNLLVHGTNMNVLANGTLQLVKGEYDFFGKKFKLTDGQIIFNDKPSPSATINLSGNLSLSDMIITAHLRGPLSSPTLTFQANPQMSTSAILARILFNKNISDISQPEAVQLATTLISLSGGAGPSVLETIRKNIGVDRLAIASQTAHPDEIAVQIGKYLTKGVLITLSQSATSSQVIVEVEFNYGFVFQAETQEEQEGKFSLKWTHSY